MKSLGKKHWQYEKPGKKTLWQCEKPGEKHYGNMKSLGKNWQYEELKKKNYLKKKPKKNTMAI